MRKAVDSLPGAMRSALSLALLAFGVAVAAGCPATQFPDEGPGQPSDWQSAVAPPGTIGVCREPFTKRPPVVNAQLWENIRRCDRNTERRYLRLGYGKSDLPDDPADRKMAAILEVLKSASSEQDGNIRMLGMLRSVTQEVARDPKYSARISRATGRTFACDYTYLFNTTDKVQRNSSSDACPAYAFDPKLRREVCLFDPSVKEASWLTSAWGCLAFTDTVGEGASCYRLCGYDDYCEGQVSCSAPDFDLTLCALGVCTPDRVAGIL